MGWKFIIFTLGVALSSCEASQLKKPLADLNSLASMMENTFETAPDNNQNIIRDRRVRIKSEALKGFWFYTQLNTGAEGKLYRQRLSHLQLSADGSTIIQKTYGLKRPELYENAWENPERLEALSANDFESYFNTGCEQVWRSKAEGAWEGYVDPKTCVISSKRRNKDIRIESEGYLSKTIYRTNERGYEMDMTFLWGTEPGEMIDLYPVR